MNFNNRKVWKILPVIIIVIIISVAAILYFLFPSSSISHELNDPKFIGKNMSFHNISYGEWVAKYWQWKANSDNPMIQFETEKCSYNQDGPVWFLPELVNGEDERTCYIPAGKVILMGIFTGIYWEDYAGQPKEEIEREAKEPHNNANVIIDINGTKSKIVMDHRVTSPLFYITIPEYSYLFDLCIENTCPKPQRAIADGYFLFYGPLEAGIYNIQVNHDNIQNPNKEDHQAAQVKYHLIVN